MKTVYLGIELGSMSVVGGCIDQNGKLLWRESLKPSESNLIHLVTKERGEVHVMIEECGMARWAYKTVKPFVTRAVVCDPKQNAWIAKDSRKCDSIDCTKLAKLLRLGEYKEVYQPENEIMYSFKKAVQNEQELSREAAKVMVQIKSHLRREGVFCTGRFVFSMKGREDAIARVPDEGVKSVIEQDFRILDTLRQEAGKALSLVKSYSDKLPIIGILQEVPGIGQKLSSRFVAYIQTPHRFKSKRQIVRYSKLGITDRSSDGKPLNRKRLEHSGNGTLKDLSRKAFHGAMHEREDNLFKRTYYNSLRTTQNKTHARLTTQRKILSVLYAMWRDGTVYDDDIDKKARV